MKALLYQVVRGADTYYETEDKEQALSMFDDLLMWGFRGGAIPETALQRREAYVGPPIGVREIRQKMVVRATGGAKRVFSPPPQPVEIDYNLENMLRQMID